MKKLNLSIVCLCFVFACGGNESQNQECTDDYCPSVIVDLVTALSAPTDQVVTVSLRDHANVFLNVSTERGILWAEIIEFQRENQKPIYLEIDPKSRVVLDYDVPIESKVHSLVDSQSAVAVQLIESAAIHYLNRSSPTFEKFLTTLQKAIKDDSLVLVTTDYDHGNQVRDVREPLKP